MLKKKVKPLPVTKRKLKPPLRHDPKGGGTVTEETAVASEYPPARKGLKEKVSAVVEEAAKGLKPKWRVTKKMKGGKK